MGGDNLCRRTEFNTKDIRKKKFPYFSGDKRKIGKTK
jgi:hypothetical protein